MLLLALGVFPLYFNGILNSFIAPMPVLYWLFEILIWIVIPLLALNLMLRIDNIGLADFGLHRTIFREKGVLAIVITSTLFAPVCFAIYFVTSIYLEPLFASADFFAYQSMIPDQLALKFLVIVYFSLTAGFVEEIFFRGVLFKVTESLKYGLVIYLILSPVTFSLVHWESGLANLLITFVFGVFVTLAYLVFRNIWPLIAGHAFTDYIWFAYTSGP